MAKPTPDTDSDCTTSYNTVFIDTNLDTHLALVVSNSDTVSDLKKKVLHEHRLCFPDTGDIKIHALKVKRRGFFYHLSESMLVKSAFDGLNKNWFVNVDASRREECNDNRHLPDPGSVDGVNLLTDDCSKRVPNAVDLLFLQDESNEHVKQKVPVADRLGLDAVGTGREDLNNLKIIEHTGADCSKLASLDTNKGSDFLVGEKYGQDSKENKVDSAQFEGEEGNSRNGVGDVQRSVPLEGAQETESGAKKSRKRKKKSKNSVDGLALKESDASLRESSKNESQQEIPVPETSLGNAGGVLSCDKQTTNQDISVLGEGSCTGVQRTNVLSRGTEVSREHIECGNDKYKNNVELSEDTSPSEPAAKKRRKIEQEKCDEDLLKENRTLISDSNKEMAEPTTISHRSLGDKQNSTNATLEIFSTESLEGAHLQSTNPSNGKRKRKKKLSNPLNQEIAAVPSSGTDIGGEISGVSIRTNPKDLVEESNAALVQKHRDPVQEVNERPSSQDIEMSDINAGNVEGRQNDSKLATASGTKRMRRSQDFILRDYQKPGTDQVDRVEEERELSQNISPKAVPSENCNPSADDEMEMKTKELVVTSKLLEASGTVNPGKSSKKRSKSKKTREVTGTPVTSDAAHVKGSLTNVSSTKPHKAGNEDHSNDKGNEGESNMPPEKEKEGSEMDTVSTFRMASDKEIADVIQNVVESVQQIEKTQLNTANMDGKFRKKAKKKRSSDAKNTRELQAENDDACHKGAAPSTDNTREMDSSSKMMEQTNLVKKSSINQLNGSNLEHEKDIMVENDPPCTALNSVSIESSQVPRHKSEANGERRCLAAVVNSCPSKGGHADKTSNDMEVSFEGDMINFNDYFVSSQQHNENVASSEVLVDEETKAKGAGTEMKFKKNKKKLDLHSHELSSHLQSSVRLNENDGIGTKPQAGKSGTTELQQSFSNDMSEKFMSHTGKKPSKIAGSVVKATPSSKSEKLKSNGEETRRSNIVKPSGTSTYENNDKEGCATTRSKNKTLRNKRGDGNESCGEHNRVDGRKASATNPWEVMNGVEHEKSLIGKSATIFDDDSYGDSADEDGVDNSDGSTRTPSDNSLSSNYSDGESSADLNSSQNGSYSLNRKEGGGKNIKSRSSSGMTLDTILRSSSSYKKAKLTASQSQLEDTESQPVDIVPDSQGNP